MLDVIIRELYRQPAKPEAIRTPGLRDTMEALIRDDIAIETFSLHSEDTPKVGDMLYVPPQGRAGIGWGDEPEWVECADTEDALMRWITQHNAELKKRRAVT